MIKKLIIIFIIYENKQNFIKNMINNLENTQEIDEINYNLIIKIYNHTMVGDILYPLKDINDETKLMEYVEWLCNFKEQIVFGILFATKLKENKVIFDVYSQFLIKLLRNIEEIYERVINANWQEQFRCEIQNSFDNFFKIIEWIIIWYKLK